MSNSSQFCTKSKENALITLLYLKFIFTKSLISLRDFLVFVQALSGVCLRKQPRWKPISKLAWLLRKEEIDSFFCFFSLCLSSFIECISSSQLTSVLGYTPSTTCSSNKIVENYKSALKDLSLHRRANWCQEIKSFLLVTLLSKVKLNLWWNPAGSKELDRDQDLGRDICNVF